MELQITSIDGLNIVEELDNTGNILARYTHQLVVDRPLSMLRSGTSSYYEQDGLGPRPRI